MLGDRAVNNWHYRLTPAGTGTDVTESFRLNQNPMMAVYTATVGQLRRRRNLRDMRKTLERIRAVAEGEARPSGTEGEARPSGTEGEARP
ncbi:hypothetical protein C6A85_000000105885, partial [Mycobacterium sp. ITM-2017-0098]